MEFWEGGLEKQKEGGVTVTCLCSVFSLGISLWGGQTAFGMDRTKFELGAGYAIKSPH